MNTVIQDFESFEHKDYKRDLNACHILLPQIQLSEGFELKFHPCSPSFGRIKKVFCRNITITKFIFEAAIT